MSDVGVGAMRGIEEMREVGDMGMRYMEDLRDEG